MDLDKTELMDESCVRLLQVQRIKLTRGTMPPELYKILNPSPEDPSPEETAPPVELAPETSADEATDSGDSSDGDAPGISPASEDAPSEDDLEGESAEVAPKTEKTPPNPLKDTEKVWSSGQLFALVADEQKTILRSRNLRVGGNESVRIQRILNAQGEV
jgi:hypothetical protein